jgi:quercetin dioxygenase-like cupin family protein
LTRRSILNAIGFVTLSALHLLHSETVVGQEKSGITHTPILKSELPNSHGQEVIVWDTEYAPGEINPRHLHPVAITFHVLSGTGIWQEDEKPPITLYAGDSLFVAAGTIHSHWNPSATERLRFLEFVVAERGKGRSIPQPLKN